MLTVQVQLVGGDKKLVSIDSKDQAAEIFVKASAAFRIPEPDLQLVSGGRVLDRQDVLHLQEGEVILAFPNGKPQARTRRD
ncbi:hypothetical protein WJX84_009230 [Apatococcus fuscideae]|uniref:Ubiquitin-like domain-containing protein n=1 Tax=Apatococcus fuscideae TaxID=2026836 RepID=A0AAW1T1R2_9CHLO